MRRYQGWVDCRFSRDADCHGWSGAGSRLGDSMESLGRDFCVCGGGGWSGDLMGERLYGCNV